MDVNKPLDAKPRDATVIENILEDMGIKDYDSSVVSMLLEYAYRHVSETLDESSKYASHANRDRIEVSDVVLTLQNKQKSNITTAGPRDIIVQLAQTTNMTQLPVLNGVYGIQLPHEQHCLLAPNYTIYPAKNHFPEDR